MNTGIRVATVIIMAMSVAVVVFTLLIIIQSLTYTVNLIGGMRYRQLSQYQTKRG